nr:MAG TPA: hypothetical protein [Caudoviricetes sp.]
MDKVIKKHLTVTSVSRGVEKLGHEIYSKDKGTAVFKFTTDELTATKVLCLFYFKDTKRYVTVNATIEGNTITVPFDSSLIVEDEPVVGYVYFEKIEQATDVYAFVFDVRLSAIDRAKNTPLIERTTGRIVDAESIVTKQELDALFNKIKEQGGTYDDSGLRAELESKADRSEIARISGQISILEQKTDKDTIYDDEPVKRRLTALESKPEINTSELVTKQELESKGYLTQHQPLTEYAKKNELPQPYNDTELKERVARLESKPEADTSGLVTKQELASKGYLTEHQPLTEYAKKSELPQSYNDTDLKQRVSRLESKPEVDTSTLVTKQELESKGYLTQHQPLTEYAKKSELPQPYNDTELKGRIQTLETKTETLATKEELKAVKLKAETPQKLSISGNVVTLSDGGGSITLPATGGTVAPANEYEIHGTGYPNGRVTAPVGTTYVDTAVTNGALKWIKRRGNDAQGWEVLTGDTGWRNLNIVSKLGNSYLRVRRKNDTVTYQFGGLSWGWFGIVRRGGVGYQLQPSDRERNVFILGLQGIPVGFRSEASLIGGIYNDKGTSYGTWYLGGVGDSNMLRFQFTDPVPTDKDIGDIRVSSIMYLTSDPWPDRLP